MREECCRATPPHVAPTEPAPLSPPYKGTTRCFVYFTVPTTTRILLNHTQSVMKSQTKLYMRHTHFFFLSLLTHSLPPLPPLHLPLSGFRHFSCLSNNLTEPHASQWDAAPIGSITRGHSILFTSGRFSQSGRPPPRSEAGRQLKSRPIRCLLQFPACYSARRTYTHIQTGTQLALKRAILHHLFSSSSPSHLASPFHLPDLTPSRLVELFLCC